MKNFLLRFYLFALLLVVFAVSGCGGGGSKTSTSKQAAQSSQSRRMIVSSAALKRGGEYSLFRGDRVTVQGTSAKYYVAPVARGNETVTMNLEFSNAVSRDLPFVITEASDESKVIFAYNPNGTGIDTTTESVTRWGGGTQKLKYSNLNLSASSADDDDTGVIDIVLKSDGTATAGGTAVPSYNYVWHADPQHPAQYWTLGNDTEELDKDEYESAIEELGTNYGIYIARDIRYTPDNLDFSTSNTAKKDEDTEYVVYYDTSSSAVSSAIAKLGETYGEAYSKDKYIFATLPSQTAGAGGVPGGMGGENPGGTFPNGDVTPPNMQSGDKPTPPDSDTRLPVMGTVNASDSASDSIPALSSMTHSASEAYENPVLHITEPGAYRLSGNWKGQIWIESGTKSKDKVELILDGVTVECTVAPALVFYKVYKWAEDNGYDNQSVLSENNLWRDISDVMTDSEGYFNLGAAVQIADGTTNTFTGANVYRILELCPKLDDDNSPKYTGSGIGTDISEQEKMYKLDGAFHSRRSIAIVGETGSLDITSTTCEGLCSEMHMLIWGGNISVTAPDDGINVNEDYVSVFEMYGGTMTVNSTGGDGIDSNGWVSIQSGTLNITAGTQSQNSAGEAGIDAENDVYISENAVYNWSAASSNGGGSSNPSGGGNDTGTDTGTNTGTNTGKDTGTDTETDTDTGTYVVIPVSETKTAVGDDTTFTLFPLSGSIEKDTEGARTIETSSSKFILEHRVNDFAGITAAN